MFKDYDWQTVSFMTSVMAPRSKLQIRASLREDCQLHDARHDVQARIFCVVSFMFNPTFYMILYEFLHDFSHFQSPKLPINSTITLETRIKASFTKLNPLVIAQTSHIEVFIQIYFSAFFEVVAAVFSNSSFIISFLLLLYLKSRIVILIMQLYSIKVSFRSDYFMQELNFHSFFRFFTLLILIMFSSNTCFLVVYFTMSE